MIPKSLKAGDKVGIICISGKLQKEDLGDNLNLLQSWNLKPVLGNFLFERHYDGYEYAGTVEQRLSDFQYMLDDKNIKAIWFARGGYGAIQLADRVNWENFHKNPKWLIGYSDLTVIHSHLNNLNTPTLHGVTVKKLNTAYNPESFETIKKIIFGEKLTYKIEPHSYNQPGSTTGKLAGGNLSIIYSMMGSKTYPSGSGLILFIEDWNENWYHLDRMMTGLKRTDLFKRLNGIVVGSFTRMDIENENPDFDSPFDPTSYQIIHRFTKELDIPVCFGFPAGHIGDNRALILGKSVNLDVNKQNVTLEFI